MKVLCTRDKLFELTDGEEASINASKLPDAGQKPTFGDLLFLRGQHGGFQLPKREEERDN
jgi:hypothetical protein